MVYFEVVPQGDSEISLAATHKNAHVKQCACQSCFALLPQYGGAAIDLALDWDGYPNHSVLLLHYTVPVAVVKLPLAQRLAAILGRHSVGRVELIHAGHESEYGSLALSANLRCELHSEDAACFSRCPVCNRQLGAPAIDEEQWLDAKEVAGRHIVTPPHGSRLIVSAEFLESLGQLDRSGLQLEAVCVK